MKIKLITISLTLIILVSLGLVLPISVSEAGQIEEPLPNDPDDNVIYVPDDYSTIQEAVEAANINDVIIFNYGSSAEKADITKKSLTNQLEEEIKSTDIQTQNPVVLFTIPNEIEVTFMVGKDDWQPETEFQIGEEASLIIETEWLRAGSHSAIAQDTTFVISDERDNIIWTRSVGPVGEGWTSGPGGGWGIGVYWEQVDMAGNPVESGIYKAGVIFTEPTFDFPEDFSGIIPLTIIDIRMPPPEGWSEDIRLTTYHTALSYPSISVDANNNIHTLWTDGRDVENYWNLYYTKIDERGNKLINDKKITSSTSYTENDRQIVADPQGNIHIVWRKDHTIGNAIYYMKLDNNGNVLIPDKFISSGTYPHLYYPSIVVDSNNNLHVSINEWAEGTRYLKLNNNGDVLIEKQSIGEHYGWWSGDPSIAVDLENNVYLTWFDTFNYEVSIHLTKIDSSGNTLIPDTKISKTLNRWEARPKIAIDSDRNIHVIWQDEDENNISQIYYTKLNSTGNTLIVDKVITNRTIQEGWIEDMSISLDLSDNLHIVWPDNRDSNFEIYYTKLDNSGNSLINDTRLTSYGGESLSPSITIDSNNKVHVVWHDNRHGFSDIYYKYGWETPSVPTYDVAVILTETSDVGHDLSSITAQPCNLLPEKVYPNGHSKEYYQDLLYCVADYHKENSFGTVNLNFTIYDNNGEWFKLDQSESYYADEFDNLKLVKDAEEKVGIEPGLPEGEKIVIVVHSGVSRQKGGKIPSRTWWKGNEIIVAAKDQTGTWAHEIGHVLGVKLTPQNTTVPDLYNMEGNMAFRGVWDLMATGSNNEGGKNPPYMSSYVKEFLGWLNYDIYPKSAYGEYWINSLETSNYGDKVFRYNLCDNANDDCSEHYILEVRNKTLRTWDSSLPEEEALVLYKVDTRGYSEYGYASDGIPNNQHRKINIPYFDGVLTPDGDSHLDMLNLLYISAISDEYASDKYKIKAEIEKVGYDFFEDRFRGVILEPLFQFYQKIIQYFPFSSSLQELSQINNKQFSFQENKIENTFEKKELTRLEKSILFFKNLKHLFGLKSVIFNYEYDKAAIRGGPISPLYPEIEKRNIIIEKSIFLGLIILLNLLIIWINKKIIPNWDWESKEIKKLIKAILRTVQVSSVIIFVIVFSLLIIVLTIFFTEASISINSSQTALNNNHGIVSAPPLEPTTSPDLDLHVYCDDGKHIGVNYETDEYEVQISGAIVSGDNQDAPEWIFVPKDITNCHFVISSYDNQRFLEENPKIAQEIKDTTDSYEVYARYIDPESDIYTSPSIFQEIEAGFQLEHSIAGTDDITINPGEVTIDSIIGEIYQYFNLGWIDEVGIKESLLSQLNNAKRKIEINQKQVAINILNAFINEIRVQGDKHVKINAAEILIKSTKELINHL